MKLSREQFVGQFGISFGVHCLRRWPTRRKAAPIHLTTCFYESIRTNRGVIPIAPADFARLVQPVIEVLHRATPLGERPACEDMAARLYEALDQAGVEIVLKPFQMISAARPTRPPPKRDVSSEA
jgi:hypothetical protein